MKLPKLYRPVVISFWALRNGLGGSMGMIFDVDTLVERVAMRILCAEGWKWQICGIESLYEYDYFVIQDQEILTEYHAEDFGGIESWRVGKMTIEVA